MIESNSQDLIFGLISKVSKLYYRLIVVVAPQGSGKTALLRKIANELNAPLINLNLELSYRMLDLTNRQRTLRVQDLLTQIAEEARAKLIPNTPAYEFNLLLLDNTELLFDVDLKQDPLRLLFLISRNNTVMCSWNGSIIDGQITYAVPEHREYRCYEIKDFEVVSPQYLEQAICT